MVLEKPLGLTLLQGGVSGHPLGCRNQGSVADARQYLPNFTADVRNSFLCDRKFTRLEIQIKMREAIV